jgi:FtsZ-binding cell division protein ZapB
MNVEELSDKSIKMLHKSVQLALDDVNNLNGYNVRNETDFKRWADYLESILSKRAVDFEKIIW